MAAAGTFLFPFHFNHCFCCNTFSFALTARYNGVTYPAIALLYWLNLICWFIMFLKLYCSFCILYNRNCLRFMWILGNCLWTKCEGKKYQEAVKLKSNECHRNHRYFMCIFRFYAWILLRTCSNRVLLLNRFKCMYITIIF